MTYNTSGLIDFLACGQRVAEHKPWPRVRLNRADWLALIERLERDDLDVMGMWAEPQEVHVAIYDKLAQVMAVASLLHL